MPKMKHSSNLEFMKVRRVYDLFLAEGRRYESKLLRYASSDAPRDLQEFTRSLIAKLSERGSDDDLHLIAALLEKMATQLKIPLTRTRLQRLRDYFQFTVLTFAGFLGICHAKGLELVANSWRDAVAHISHSGSLRLAMKVLVPLLAKIIFAAEGSRFLRRAERLPGEIGPVLDLQSARAYFRSPEEQKRRLAAHLEFCRPAADNYTDFAPRAREIIGKDDPFAYNIGTGGLLIQGSLHFEDAYYLLEELFESSDPVRKYEAHRVYMYILEVWPETVVPEPLIREAVHWTREILDFRRRTGEPQKLPLDYSYPISQLCLILSRKTDEGDRRAMEFMNGWLAQFVASSGADEKIFIIRGLKQYQQLIGRFSDAASTRILEFAETKQTDQDAGKVRDVALLALRELVASFPEECTNLIKIAIASRNIPGLQEIRAKGRRGLPQHSGHSVNLTRFFQNILVYGGDVRSLMLNLLQKMPHARSLESYLSYLGQWFLDAVNLDRLATATRSVTTTSQISPDLSKLPGVLEHLDDKHQRQRQKDAKRVPE